MLYYRTIICYVYCQARDHSMSQDISSTSVGKKLALLRKQKGYSQEELAKLLSISRSSLAQTELGNRGVDIREFFQFGQVLGFSLDAFFSIQSDVVVADGLLRDVVATYETKERVSEPQFQSDKFREIVLFMLEQCAGKPNINESMLGKLLYFSDFNHYELYETQLTGATYRKVTIGPTPLQLDTVLDELMTNGVIQRHKVTYNGLPQVRYLPLQKPDLTQLLASEITVVDRVLDQFGDWSASAVQSYAQKDLPWMATREGDVIDYELVFYREAPYSVRTYDDVDVL
jgi:transcriptional regulator with XRE-family HTH domain